MLLPDGFTDPECYAKELAAFVNSSIFQLLTVGIHHLDAFLTDTLDDPWQKLPRDWQIWFEDSCGSLEEQERRLQDVRTKGATNFLGRPKTLDDFLYKLRSLALPRLQENLEPKPADDQSIDLSSDLLKGMSIKKRVEVVQFAKVVKDLTDRVDVGNAIDIGAGFGYLSRTLSHPKSSKPLQVLAIDGSPSQIKGSIALSTQASSSTPELSITYLVQRISSAKSGHIEIGQWLQKKGPAVVIGLHCCGSLTDDVLSMFMRTTAIKGVAVIGCCYNHLRTSSNPAELSEKEDHADTDVAPAKFPSSNLLSSYSVQLSSTARMAACQNVESWADVPNSEKEMKKRREVQYLSRKKKHFRRLFTRLLFSPHLSQEIRPSLESIRLGSIPTDVFSSFARYASYVLSKLELLTEENSKQLIEEAESIEKRYSDWRWDARGRVIETLGKSTGEVAECIIAIDRFLTLKNHLQVDPESVDIIQNWKYRDSPRNLILVAQKIPL